MSLAVVIPTLNASRTLGRALASVRAGAASIIVVDGGSDDETQTLAKTECDLVLAAKRGRGSQLQAGAAAALAMPEVEWLLFLHADTRLTENWHRAASEAMAAPRAGEHAFAFRLRLDDAAPAARRLERLVAWRCRRLGLPYGDQGLLIHRDLYSEVGGYRALPLMEDVDLIRRIGRKRVRLLEADAITSAVRYQRGGYIRRPLRNLSILALYFAGVSPRTLAWLYG